MALPAPVDHRPWPVPSGSWALAMSWHDLLFAHWPIPVAALREVVPSALEVDTFGGAAWVGVVPFRMTGVRIRGMPAMPGPGAFLELNVRTYVVRDGRPGVWFISLDAASRIAVFAARRWFHLPYFNSSMECARGDEILYRSKRFHCSAPPAEFVGSYAPTGDVACARPGSLEHWLAERYCLYSATPEGAILRGDIHHATWPLQPARATIDVNSMASAAGIALPDERPHLLFARRLDVVAWAPERVRRASRR